MAEVFSFRPAALRRARDWRLDGDVLHGPDGTLDLRAVTALRFTDLVVRGNRMRRLDIEAGALRLRPGVNAPEATGPAHPDRAALTALILALAARLAERDPALPVTLGEGGAARWWMFGFGCLALAAAVGLTVAAALGGDALAPALAAVPLGVLGLVLVGGNAPWRAPVTLAVADLPALIEALDGPSA